MPFLSFDAYPLWLNALGFLLSAGTIWFAGVRLEQQADTISEWTGMGRVFTGMLLLASATSLPEVSPTTAASRHGRYTMTISKAYRCTNASVAAPLQRSVSS